MNIASNLILILITVIASNISLAAPISSKELDRDTLCNKFPLNSRCEGFTVNKSEPQIYQLDRERFCANFAFNSRCQKAPVEVIKLNLDRSGEDDEWVRIEKEDNKVKLLHTTRVKDGLASAVLDGAIGLIPIPFPVPFIDTNKYSWEDHQTIEVSFKKDDCQKENCTVRGKDTVVISQDSNVYAGVFTIDYQEKDTRRSLSFRIPQDLKAETIDTLTIERDH